MAGPELDLESQAGSPQPEVVNSLLKAARAGDEVAYAKLHSTFGAALAGSILRATGCLPREAIAWADQVWQKNRALILRLPAEGGYAGAGAFHRYVLNECSGWFPVRNEENLARRREVPWPRTEEGHLVELPDPNAEAAHQFMIRRKQFALLLQIIFDPRVGYPHQQLSFVLSRYVYGQVTPRGLDGNPGAVKAKHALTALRDLAAVIASEYGALAVPDFPFNGEFCPCLASLYARLGLTVSELMRSDGASLSQFQRLARQPVGKTLLQDYFPQSDDGAEAAISLWTCRVGQRVRKLLGLHPNLAGDDQLWSRIEGVASKVG